MNLFSLAVTLACAAAVTVAAPVTSAQAAKAAKVAPEAADQTLGMALMGAAVRGNGTLYEGVGVVSATRSGTGAYRVTFQRDIRGCILNATAALFPGDSSTGAFASASYYSQTTVSVLMRNPSGTFVDHSIQLMVFCAK